MVSFTVIAVLIATVIIPVTAFDFYNGRIIGGQTATVGQFPHQVSLLNSASDDYICGGFIINHRWIGSAAHCTITLFASDLVLVYGRISLTEIGIRNLVERIINHSEYISVKLQNDVSIIKTVDSILFTDTVKPVIFDNTFVYESRKAIVSGHGSLQVGEPRSDLLQYITKNTISNTDCISKLDTARAERIVESSLCTLILNGEGICNGDAGNALIFDGAIIGIASWGVPCGLSNPDVYSRISTFIGWILNEIRNN